MHTVDSHPTASASVLTPPHTPNTQVRRRRQGGRQVTKYSRMRRPRRHCCIWSTTHIPNTICRCTLGTGSPRRCCRHKQPPPWAARPRRPGLPAAPERGPRAPPGDSDAPDELPPRGRRSRLRSATRTTTRSAYLLVISPCGNEQWRRNTQRAHKERRDDCTASAGRAHSERRASTQRAQGEHTASAEHAHSCCTSDHNSEHGERTAVTGVRERGT